MTPAARLQAVLEVCGDVEVVGSRPADQVLEAYFRARRFMGAHDRRAVTERVYGLLRRRARLDWWVARAGSGLPQAPRTRMLADLALSDSLDPTSIAALFADQTYGPSALTAPEADFAARLAGQSLVHPDMPSWVAGEYPAWLEEPLRAAFGDRLALEMAALNEPAPLDLRVNLAHASRASAMAALAAEGVAALPSPQSPAGLRCASRPRLGSLGAFRKGLVEVQDEGSQIVARCVDVAPGMTVVDYCAGGGGKTLALADGMMRDGKVVGQLWACDVDPVRLARMDERLRRSRLGPVRRVVLAPDGKHGLARALAGRADRVLVDVPCSGTGTWRRHPEAKWRLAPDELRKAVADQAAILAEAAALVRVGGRLVYATCSVLREENEEQVERFVATASSFVPVGPPLRLSPARTATDGFFVAVLERTD